MGATSIEWTDHSINPLRASLVTPDGTPAPRSGHYCEKVSPGCKHCYSSRLQPRFGMPQFQEQRRLDVRTWLDVRKLEEVLRRRKPTKYFWCDMTDMFGDWVPFEMIAACFGVMAATPQHTHQVLTKRAGRMREWFGWVARSGTPQAACEHAAATLLNDYGCDLAVGRVAGWPLPNVWLGVSAEDQQRADERIPHLLATPAAVRFVSAEPLLGPLDFTNIARSSMPWHPPGPPGLYVLDALRGTVAAKQRGVAVRCGRECAPLSWVIAGGESGPGARPHNIVWTRSLVAQCRSAAVACFVKQLGRSPYADSGLCESPTRLVLRDRKGADPAEWPIDLRVQQMPGEAS